MGYLKHRVTQLSFAKGNYRLGEGYSAKKVAGAWNVLAGAGVRSQESGVRSQESGVRRGERRLTQIH
jgi:hypothetical protein